MHLKFKVIFLFVLFFLSSCVYDEQPFDSLEAELPCPVGQVFCDGACVFLETKQHCGSCGDVCVFDRECREAMADGEGTGVFRCVCPEGLADCGRDLSCLPLDGGGANSNGGRCGDCNTICAESEQCQEIIESGEGQYACTCFVDEKVLSGQALSDAYLISREHCGGCGQACLGSAAACVLGVCLCGEGDAAAPCAAGERCSEWGCVCGEGADAGRCTVDEKCVDDLCVCAKDSACKGEDVDSCAEGLCVCGETGGPCLGDRVCVDGRCSCLDKDDCAGDERCFEGRCVCVEASACKGDKVDRCVDGICVCGDTGAACEGDRVCVDGRCLCTEDSDCPDYESCDVASGQCHCGGAKSCAVGSSCTEAGYCRCDSDGACHDAETCKDVGAFGQVCVCGSSLQKACRLGARCGYKLFIGTRCYQTGDNACYEGEQLKRNSYCVCGDANKACRPGESCVGGKCEPIG